MKKQLLFILLSAVSVNTIHANDDVGISLSVNVETFKKYVKHVAGFAASATLGVWAYSKYQGYTRNNSPLTLMAALFLAGNSGFFAGATLKSMMRK